MGRFRMSAKAISASEVLIEGVAYETDAHGDLLFDDYDNPVESGRPRLRGCRCPVPCKAFRCRSRHHRHNRASPWCVGGEGESCASCWLIEDKRRERAARRRAA